jgi:hypothetical protein
MHESVQVFHLISHFHDHHGGKKYPSADVRHLLSMLVTGIELPYLRCSTIQKIELQVKIADVG